MTIHVVIDSTEYSGDPLRSKAKFQALRRLAEAGVVKLHMPYVVRGELISHIRESFHEIIGNGLALQHGVEAIEAVNGGNPLPELQEIRGIFSNLIEKLENVRERFHQRVEEEVDEWLVSLGAETYEIHADVAKDAIDSYFSGTGPFPAPRMKNHLPDALIFSQFKMIAKGVSVGDELCFVSNDDNLRKKVEQIDQKIKTFKNLHQFINQDICLRALRFANQYLSVNMPVFQQALLNNVSNIRQRVSDSLSEAITTKVLRKHGMLIAGQGTIIESMSLHPEVEIKASDARDYGNGTIVVPVSLTIDCEFSAWVDKFTYGELEEYDINDLEVIDEDEYTVQVHYAMILGIDAIASANLNTEGEKHVTLNQLRADSLVENAHFKLDEIIMMGT